MILLAWVMAEIFQLKQQEKRYLKETLYVVGERREGHVHFKLQKYLKTRLYSKDQWRSVIIRYTINFTFCIYGMPPTSGKYNHLQSFQT